MRLDCPIVVVSGAGGDGVGTTDALFDNPNLNAVGLFDTVDTPHGAAPFPGVPTWVSRTPARVARRPPLLGDDTDDVLAEVAHSDRAGSG